MREREATVSGIRALVNDFLRGEVVTEANSTLWSLYGLDRNQLHHTWWSQGGSGDGCVDIVGAQLMELVGPPIHMWVASGFSSVRAYRHLCPVRSSPWDLSRPSLLPAWRSVRRRARVKGPCSASVSPHSC